MQTRTRPAFRKPWEHGARAYPEADSLEALFEGAKRRRNTFDVLVGGLGEHPCASCGIALQDAYPVNPGGPTMKTDDPSRGFRVIYSPRSRRWVARHYYCSWGALMQGVLELGRR
jgi:hypothetical protein